MMEEKNIAFLNLPHKKTTYFAILNYSVQLLFCLIYLAVICIHNVEILIHKRHQFTESPTFHNPNFEA